MFWVPARFFAGGPRVRDGELNLMGGQRIVAAPVPHAQTGIMPAAAILGLLLAALFVAFASSSAVLTTLGLVRQWLDIERVIVARQLLVALPRFGAPCDARVWVRIGSAGPSAVTDVIFAALFGATRVPLVLTPALVLVLPARQYGKVHILVVALLSIFPIDLGGGVVHAPSVFHTVEEFVHVANCCLLSAVVPLGCTTLTLAPASSIPFITTQRLFQARDDVVVERDAFSFWAMPCHSLACLEKRVAGGLVFAAPFPHALVVKAHGPVRQRLAFEAVFVLLVATRLFARLAKEAVGPALVRPF